MIDFKARKQSKWITMTRRALSYQKDDDDRSLAGKSSPRQAGARARAHGQGNLKPAFIFCFNAEGNSRSVG